MAGLSDDWSKWYKDLMAEEDTKYYRDAFIRLGYTIANIGTFLDQKYGGRLSYPRPKENPFVGRDSERAVAERGHLRDIIKRAREKAAMSAAEYRASWFAIFNPTAFDTIASMLEILEEAILDE